MTASNRGATSLRTRRRDENPMQAFNALPAPVRSWLSQAALPWSAASCRKILRQARARGESLDDVLARLDRAQQKTLARDRYARCGIIAKNHSFNQQDRNT
ncbi:hypothetical protein SAMN04488040_1623 [Sulfitobacter marinus]|uniref:Uncharacterized protein n=1 Tax=Sulfitobacter marinus TaxID=394264 RepID=A0A1I6RWL2_9RHOB|nr:DUF6525 family protein [Sulfitobacter marinus]SFS69089.1 hypothetical protein SAMN04488040_1623 [Sulfitobacter marinus]